jgi:hypothetical protein
MVKNLAINYDMPIAVALLGNGNIRSSLNEHI